MFSPNFCLDPIRPNWVIFIICNQICFKQMNLYLKGAYGKFEFKCVFMIFETNDLVEVY